MTNVEKLAESLVKIGNGGAERDASNLIALDNLVKQIRNEYEKALETQNNLYDDFMRLMQLRDDMMDQLMEKYDI